MNNSTVKQLIQEFCSQNSKDKTKYQCPVCNGWNLSVSKRNNGYKCFNGCDTKMIAKELNKRHGENNATEKKYRKNFTAYFYNKEDGTEGIKVTRKDLDSGKKEIRQYTYSGTKWEPGYKYCSRNEVSLYDWENCKKCDEILLVEGEKCVEVSVRNGFNATTIIGGSGVGGDTPLYPLVLKQLSSFKKVTLCPDRDKPGIKFMQRVAEQLKGQTELEWLYLHPESESWKTVPESNGYDIADYFSGTEFDIPEDWYKSNLGKDSTTNEVVDISKLKTVAAQKQFLSEVVAGRIKLNLLTNDIELDGKTTLSNGMPISYEDILANFPDIFGCEIPWSPERFTLVLSVIAGENAYDPLLDYFESLPPSDYSLGDVAVKYFGCKPNSIHCEMVERWLISAVARTYEPGCQADSALILYEPIGGVGKSRWFENLLPNKNWYCANMGDINNKDERLKLHQYKLIEWGELDGLFGMRASAVVKSFLSCSSDNIRTPYARNSRKLPRRSIICGTTNKKELIMDTSGIRRFWVVPVTLRSIPLEFLKAERDLIWGAAVQYYKAGIRWWLENKSVEAHRESLGEFIHKPEYQEDVELFIENIAPRQQFTVEEIVKALGIPDLHVRKFQQALKRILEDLGWKEARIRQDGKNLRAYRCTAKKTSGTQAVHPQTPTTTTTTPLVPDVPVIYKGEKIVENEILNANSYISKNILQEGDDLQFHKNTIREVGEESGTSGTSGKKHTGQAIEDVPVMHRKNTSVSHLTANESKLNLGQAILYTVNGQAYEGVYCGFQKNGEYVGDVNCVVLLRGRVEQVVVRRNHVSILSK
ncbi:MAG: hypothetical protein F6K08_16880 [Okeania sp. SIO1H6]|nr:hypothetical protein [Okeania sp. SIO1H6]